MYYVIAMKLIFFLAAQNLNLLAMCGDFFILVEGRISLKIRVQTLDQDSVHCLSRPWSFSQDTKKKAQQKHLFVASSCGYKFKFPGIALGWMCVTAFNVR